MNRRSSQSTSRYNLKKLFSVWLMQHAQACVFSLGQLWKNPLNALLTTAVVGIALSLPAGFYLLLENFQRVASSWDNGAEITLFMKQGVSEERILEISGNIREYPNIREVRYVSAEEALRDFQSQSGFDNTLVLLDENPIPALLLIQPAVGEMADSESSKLMTTLRELEEVDSAQFDKQWIQRLFAIIEIVRKAVLLLGVMLAMAVLLIVGNTIRLAIYNRKSEIEVNKLFGATDAFIQRPFLYSGLFHGLGGSILAWALLSFSLQLLESPVSRLAQLYSSGFVLQGLSAKGLAGLFVAGALLGLVGSWTSVKRHIRAIEPA